MSEGTVATGGAHPRFSAVGMRTLISKAKRLARGARRRLTVGNRVFLTFDDGPLETFAAILDRLDAYDAKATFFFVASRIDRSNLHLVRKALLNGHKIGNHSWSHLPFSEISAAEIEHEIVAAHDVIDQILRKTKGKGVQKPEQRFFRFPWLDNGARYQNGNLIKGSPAKRDAARTTLTRLGYRVVGVSIESRDWAIELGEATVNEVEQRILQAGRGDVVLMHDRPSAPEILERVLPQLTQRWRMAAVSARRV